MRFLALVVLAWTAGRSIALWPGALADVAAPAIRYAAPLIGVPMRGEHIAIRLDEPAAVDRARTGTVAALPAVPETVAQAVQDSGAVPAIMQGSPPDRDDDANPLPMPAPPMQRMRRLSVSGWAIMRGSGDVPLAGRGQLGGSQVGLRAAYGLNNDRSIAVAARLSGPLSNDAAGRELAIGMEWQPVMQVPARLLVERRFALNGTGRDRFAIGLFGGVDGIVLPAGFRLDGYGQTGIVGLSRPDAYVDGALRVERPLGKQGPVSFAIGGGLWGAAQPGLSRVDAGPQIVMRVPTGVTILRVGLDWRQRISGNARPGSGPALSVGADF